ncbi:MAG: ribosome silencing factor [Anaerolineales bacterium]|nr:ribosome silencing factor [Anaerolineales bacterium]
MDALEDKKGENIVLLDIQNVAPFADYFVICTGSSDRMLDALAEGAIDSIREKYRKKPRRQGTASTGWVLVDYGDIVVHLFSPDQRDFYQIEELWSDGKILLRLK